jgi:hypothetical protein
MIYRHHFNFPTAIFFLTFASLLLFPNFAGAQQLQINSQSVSGSATASGDDAFANTEIDQFSHQDLAGEFEGDRTQISIQQGNVNSTAIGNNTNASGYLDQFSSQAQNNNAGSVEFGNQTQFSNQQGTINSTAIGNDNNAVNSSQQNSEQNIFSF